MQFFITTAVLLFSLISQNCLIIPVLRLLQASGQSVLRFGPSCWSNYRISTDVHKMFNGFESFWNWFCVSSMAAAASDFAINGIRECVSQFLHIYNTINWFRHCCCRRCRHHHLMIIMRLRRVLRFYCWNMYARSNRICSHVIEIKFNVVLIPIHYIPLYAICIHKVIAKSWPLNLA